MKIPTYLTTEEQDIYIGGVRKTLPANSFVQIIHPYYLPKHVIEREGSFNPERDCYCYTHYGIIKLYLKILRKV